MALHDLTRTPPTLSEVLPRVDEKPRYGDTAPALLEQFADNTIGPLMHAMQFEVHAQLESRGASDELMVEWQHVCAALKDFAADLEREIQEGKDQ